MKFGTISIVIIVIALIGGGVWYFMSRSDEATETESMEQEAMMEQEEPTQFEDTSSSTGEFLQLAPTNVPAGSPAAVEGEAAASETATITMDETGFTPETITVAAGTTVTFVNNGQAPHWPASDVHPTHEILAEFDANRGLQTGETYSYTFTDVGTWNCHDHLAPNNTCTIVVE